MQESLKQLAAILTVLLSGIAVEVILAFVRDEPLNLVRLGTLGGFLLVMLLVLALARSQRISLRAVVAGGLVVIGLAAATTGIVILLSEVDATETVVGNVLGMAMTSAGTLVFLSGLYVAVDRRVTPAVEEYEPVAHVSSKPVRRGDPAGTVTKFAGFAAHTDRIVDLCAEELSPDDLHYVAYYVDGQCRFYVDVLGDRRLDGFFDETSRDERRQRYEAYGRHVHDIVGALNVKFEAIDSGHLIRVVLDVEKGALYYFFVDKNRFVLGVTMDQGRVLETDEKMVRLVDRVRVSLGHKPIADLNRPAAADHAVLPFPARPKNGPAA